MGSETEARLKPENKFGIQSVESDESLRGDGRSAPPRSLPPFKLNAEEKVLVA